MCHDSIRHRAAYPSRDQRTPRWCLEGTSSEKRADYGRPSPDHSGEGLHARYSSTISDDQTLHTTSGSQPGSVQKPRSTIVGAACVLWLLLRLHDPTNSCSTRCECSLQPAASNNGASITAIRQRFQCTEAQRPFHHLDDTTQNEYILIPVYQTDLIPTVNSPISCCHLLFQDRYSSMIPFVLCG